MEYKPSTIAEKLRRLKKAMDFLDHQNFEDIKHQHIVQYRNLLTSWINSLSKDIAIQRQERGIKLDSEVAHTISPYPFLNNDAVKRKVAIS